MKFKEFSKWCNDICCDACWGMKYPFWKREKIWKERFKDETINSIVNPTNELIKKYRGE